MRFCSGTGAVLTGGATLLRTWLISPATVVSRGSTIVATRIGVWIIETVFIPGPGADDGVPGWLANF